MHKVFDSTSTSFFDNLLGQLLLSLLDPQCLLGFTLMAGLLTACETGKDNSTADSSPGADFDIRTQALRAVAIGERKFMMRTALGAFRKRLPSVTTANDQGAKTYDKR
jgi:hypothetical protein